MCADPGSREDVTQMKLGASKYDILFDKACFDSVLVSSCAGLVCSMDDVLHVIAV